MLLITNAHIKTMAGIELENGCILIDESGKIGEGTHKRAIVATQRFLDKTYAKL